MSSDSGSETDESSSGSSSTYQSESDSESDFSVGRPEPEDLCVDDVNNDEQSSALCLFCNEKLDVVSFSSHVKSSHEVDLSLLRQKFSMDQLSFIKFVNYVRLETRKINDNLHDANLVAEQLSLLPKKLSDSEKILWESDEYLRPVIEDDALLSYWFDDEDEPEDDMGKSEFRPLKTEISSDEMIKVENAELRTKIAEYEGALAESCEKIQLMKEVMNRILGDDTNLSKHKILKRYSEALSRNNEEYFESYDDLQIHAIMINDTQRTETYRDAILNNASDFCGKTILDVGCGTSILSMFAAKAGASKVFAVDRSKIIEKAVEIVRENGFEDIIECIQGTVESTNLPVDKVDIILSEFMGYFLLFEGMLSSYIDARNKFLRPGGAMYPNTAEVFVIGISDLAKFEQQETMWDNVYGFKMSAMKQKRKLVPQVETVPEDKCVTDPFKVLSLDLMVCEYSDSAFRTDFSLSVTRDSTVTALAGYFDTGFSMGKTSKYLLSTSPKLPETHWYQTVFPLEKPISVKKGDVVHGVMDCRPNLKNSRSLDVSITIGEDKYTYLLD